jgi:hypothetical protein
MIRLNRIKEQARSEGAREVTERVKEVIGAQKELSTASTIELLRRLVVPMARSANTPLLDGEIIRPPFAIPAIATVNRSFYPMGGYNLRLRFYSEEDRGDFYFECTFDNGIPEKIRMDVVVGQVRHAIWELLTKVSEGWAMDISRQLLMRLK